MTTETETRGEKIERAIDKSVTKELTVYGAAGALNIAPQSMSELMEFAKMMALGGVMVRMAFRNNPGACLAISMQSFRWGMDPFAVANKAYLVKNKAGEEQVAYEAQLVHAVVNARAPLKGRLRTKYDGAGPTRRCIVTGTLKGETETSVYESPEFAKIGVKNSPLWAGDPDQQLHYYSTRAWARRFVPEVLLGIYTPEEIDAQEHHYGPDHAKDITPRPSRAAIEAAAAPAAEVTEPETFELFDHTGEVEQKAAYPEQWVRELLTATLPTPEGAFTEKALGYLDNNADAVEQVSALVKDDALVGKLQARYAEAAEWHQETKAKKDQEAKKEMSGRADGAGGEAGSTQAPSAAAPQPGKESAPPTPTPTAATEAAGGQQNSAGSPAVPPAPTPAAPPAPAETVPVAEAPKPAEPAPAPQEPPPEGPAPLDLPLSTKTNKPSPADYLTLMQKEMMADVVTRPEHVDMIMAREGLVGPGKYAPGSNLAKIGAINSGTPRSIEMFAARRKNTLAANSG